MFLETNYLESQTGARLAWHYEPAQGEAKGIILIAHGLAEHSKRYVRFAEFLGLRGCHVYAWDHRGHGETTAPDAILGQFAKEGGDEKVLEDIVVMRDMAAAKHPGLPIILFGHSMGAFFSFVTAIRSGNKFDGFAVWNNDFSSAKGVPALKVILKLTAIFKGSDTPANLVAKQTFEAWGKAVPNHRTLFDWLSNIDSEVQAYIDDPLCGFTATVSLWQDLANIIQYGANVSNIARIGKQKPFHLLAGAKDPASGYSKGIKWLGERLNEAGVRNVHTVIYPDARHETLNDIRAQDAMEDFANWADGVTRSHEPT